MQIAIIGLGLIGGSLAKTIRIRTEHTVYGYDIDDSVIRKAKLLEAIDNRLTDALLAECDMVIVALYPGATVDYIRRAAPLFRKNAVVIDCCGIKQYVSDAVRPIAAQYGFTFIGGHPMAGIEQWGFDHARGTLFQKASMILTPDTETDILILQTVKQFFLSLGFGSVVLRTPPEHDRVIAYTSQLAHILSNAYVKSETAVSYEGISAGSFRDMTRVATMNVPMWTELFFRNKDALLSEVDTLICNLTAYRDVLRQDDPETMQKLLQDGVTRKNTL